MDTSLKLLDDIWNACLDEVLKEIDARIWTCRTLRAEHATLRDDLSLLYRAPSEIANHAHWHTRPPPGEGTE